MKVSLVVAILLTISGVAEAEAPRRVPERIPPKRSSQITEGFGVNTPLPRDPWLPWNRRWWTRLYDGGFTWVRLGQYENSSDKTSWDWVEQRRNVLRVPPDVDDYIDWLVDNGVNIQLQLCYGNPMYTGLSGKPPDSIRPAPGTSHADDGGIYSIYRGPNTPEQIAAFNRYAAYVIRHFKGRIRYYELWNEPNAHFWHPQWDTGNGDIGNQGPHEMDLARWALNRGLPKHDCAPEAFRPVLHRVRVQLGPRRRPPRSGTSAAVRIR